MLKHISEYFKEIAWLDELLREMALKEGQPQRGVERHQSSRWKKLASIPESKFEEEGEATVEEVN